MSKMRFTRAIKKLQQCMIGKPHTGTTNGLPHGTQFGVLMRELRTRDSARGDACRVWRCWSGEVVRAMPRWRKF